METETAPAQGLRLPLTDDTGEERRESVETRGRLVIGYIEFVIEASLASRQSIQVLPINKNGLIKLNAAAIAKLTVKGYPFASTNKK
uniref:PRC domain-containing protein n=1 Tax=Caenorhabditis tropicalis TaxID=1561998 RepID=A0A1I7UWX4_9PELO